MRLERTLDCGAHVLNVLGYRNALEGLSKGDGRLRSYEESTGRMVNRRALVRGSNVHKKEGKMLRELLHFL